MSNGNVRNVTKKPIMAKDATLRDMFAGQALTGLLSRMNGERLSISCYKYADAMIAERNKTV